MQATSTVDIMVARGGMQSMAFFAFLFSGTFALLNSVLTDCRVWPKKRHWVRPGARLAVFIGLFLFIMKTKWLHNWLSNVVLRWLTTENYPPLKESSIGSDTISGMLGVSVWTWLFYFFVVLLAAIPIRFVWHYWTEAQARGWDWISNDSRGMYVDGAKTLITASGIAVALLASSAVSSARTSNSLVETSAKIAVVCLISCVCVSLIVILALLRGFEQAQSRNIDEQRAAGKQIQTGEGRLTPVELRLILIPTGIALYCFLLGFVFLGRIAFHF